MHRTSAKLTEQFEPQKVLLEGLRPLVRKASVTTTYSASIYHWSRIFGVSQFRRSKDKKIDFWQFYCCVSVSSRFGTVRPSQFSVKNLKNQVLISKTRALYHFRLGVCGVSHLWKRFLMVSRVAILALVSYCISQIPSLLLDSSNDELLGMLFRQVPWQSVPSRASRVGPARYSTS